MCLSDGTDRLLRSLQRGTLTQSEFFNELIQLIIYVNDIDASIELVERLPVQFRSGFRARLSKLAQDNYIYNLPWCIEDKRTKAERDESAWRDRPILLAIVPQLIAKL